MKGVVIFRRGDVRGVLVVVRGDVSYVQQATGDDESHTPRGVVLGDVVLGC